MIFYKAIYIIYMISIIVIKANEFLYSNHHTVNLTVQKGLLIIPGLGRKDRLSIVITNLKIIYNDLNTIKSNMKWDCIIYIYAPRELLSFWSMNNEINFISSLCDIIEVPNQRVATNLYMVQPALIYDKYHRILLLLDDCKLTDTFYLENLLSIMNRNNLTVISPLISGANKGGGQKFRNIMQTSAIVPSIGYISSFVEIFVWLMTIPAYIALWELLLPHINPYAWGYDFWYDGYAMYNNKVIGHKMGIASNMIVIHEQNELLGRTDNTGIKAKWNAVLAQERHYKKYLNIDLAYFRTHLNIHNTSWNGAVKGYLY